MSDEAAGTSASSSKSPSEGMKSISTSAGDDWDVMYQKLCSYVEKYRSEGRTHCPLFSTDLAQAPADVDPDVVAWVKEQRRQYRNLRERIGDTTQSSPPLASDLDLERIIDLERIGFTWELKHDIEWRKRYEELCEYKRKYNTCLVPAKYERNKKLGLWVMTQRRQNILMMAGKPSRMTKERKRLLNDIGFVWILRERRHKVWKQRIEEMKKFKEDHGHFDALSPNYPEYQELAEWLRKIRYHYQRLLKGQRVSCSMAEDAISELDDIGFNWSLLAPLKYKGSLPDVCSLLAETSSNDLQVCSALKKTSEDVTKPSISSTVTSHLLPVPINGYISNNFPPMMPYALVNPNFQQYGMPNTVEVNLSPTNILALQSLHLFPPFSYH